MGALPDKSLIKRELVSILDDCYILQDEITNTKNLNVHEFKPQTDTLNTQVNNAVQKYIDVTNTKLTNAEKSLYVEELNKNFKENLKNSKEKNANSLQVMTQVAFKRLVNASKDYYFAKMKNEPNSRELKRNVQKYKKEYELLHNIN